jgi:endoglucanase
MKKLIILIFLLASVNVYSKKYKGAEIRTSESFTYGKFEVRMKSAKGSGMLSSFFTFYDEPDFAQNWNEIDLEILGRYNNEMQCNIIHGKHKMHEHRQVLNFNPHASFHVYAMEWTPEYIAWQVDGKEVYRQDGDYIKEINKTQKLMMNIWPSTFWAWTGVWSDSILPLYAYYDYVKYYEFKPSSKSFSLSWTDNFDTFDMERWQTATHTFDGNSCDFEPLNVVFKVGYLILCLTKEDNIGYNGGVITDMPQVISATLLPDNLVRVSFSQVLNTLENETKKTNFKIEGAVVKKIKLNSDKKSLDLTIEGEDLSVIDKLKYSLYEGTSVQEVSIKK